MVSIPKSERETPMHYYSFGFVGGDENGSVWTSAYVGFRGKRITIPKINYAKRQANPNIDPVNMVLIAATYLGFMTADQMESNDDGPDEGDGEIAAQEGQLREVSADNREPPETGGSPTTA